MKKIGIITYHNVCNYGAVLQAFSTQQFFKNRNYDAYIIDYSPEYDRTYGTLKNTFHQKEIKDKDLISRIIYTLIKTPSYKKQNKIFKKFIKDNLILSQEYNTYNDLENIPPLYDVYCTGSDQVWNNYFLSKFDPAFFLDFVPENSKCISFASSFGRDDFNSEEMEYIKNKLKKYNIITVREKNGKEMLNKLGFNNVDILLDPTLLLDFSYWDDFSLKKNKYKFPYILIYQLHGDSNVYNNAKKFAKDKGIKIINITTTYHNLRIGCINVFIPTVEEFVTLFKNATYIFTDSFHGVIFSLIFSKKLAAILPKKFNGRIVSLLELINGENCIFDTNDSWIDIIDDNYMKKCNENLIQLQQKNIEKIEKILQ